MQQGDEIAGRFEIEALTATGGMGQIFRARDRQSGEYVAIKMLLADLGGHDARFEHETRALSELVHPGIVRYVAHGLTDAGEAYLAMEWLEGEDLSRRIERGGLTIEDSLTIASRVAEALGAAHAQGIVHRDLKPSNIFLVGQRVDRVKVLDFGIARLGGVTRVTRTGTIVGTPGYMAPEQVQNDRPVDARADVFSLGCVLFECVTGLPAFAGEHLMALLAKVLFAEPARLRDLRPEAPTALEQLLSRMMAKDPEQRPRDGGAAVEELRALGEDASTRVSTLSKVALTSAERRTISVVLVEADPAVPISDDATLDKAAADAMQALRKGAETFGGRLEHLRDGSVAVSIVGAGLATDQAAQAARCALWLRANVGGRAVALATGRGEITGRLAAAEAIDRAAKLLVSRASERVGAVADGSPPVAIDETTARLLDGRFDVREDEAGSTLHGEREIAEGARLLLKKPTACVGRDRELANLTQMFAECVDESQAHAALVTGSAGMGKSRLVHELLARLRERDERIAVWIGRGDVLRAGSALGLLGQALRGACGIRGDEPLPERREKLLARVAQRVAASDRQRVAELLGEITGVPFPDESSDLLRAARRNAQIMTDEMRRAWVDFLRAECAAEPVFLVLEDLHWGDLPTVQFVDAALRDLAGRPWMVLAVARPEVHTLFPKLWEGRHVQEIELKPLGKKASERLVRQVLGHEIGVEITDRLIAQADGNAFYLEELIRAATERRDERFPETVVAMVQSRLAALGEEDRRTLRAAAVFGEAFWPGGVAALLDSGDRAAQVQSRLLGLVEREVLVRRPESRFSGEVELAFRHVLLREGAYAMLTADDMTLGHRLAGEWLLERGEGDPMVLAGHFERGGQPKCAADYYLHAAEQASQAGDSEAGTARAQRGIECGVKGDLRMALLGAICEMSVYRRQSEGTILHYAKEVMDMAPPGSAPWAQAVVAMLSVSMKLGRMGEFMAALAALQKIDPSTDAVSATAFAFTIAIYALDAGGQIKFADAILHRFHEVVAPVVAREPLASAYLQGILALRDVKEEPWSALQASETMDAEFRRARYHRGTLGTPLIKALNLWALGALTEAERALRAVTLLPEESALISSLRPFVLAAILIDRGAFDDALTEAANLVEMARARQLSWDEGRGRWALAEAYRHQGNHASAEREALEALELLGAVPPDHISATATLAAVRLAQGRTTEALAAAQDALIRYGSVGACSMFRGAYIRLVHAECLRAAGDHEAALAAITAARARVVANAAKIDDPEYRKSFLENVPENRRTLDLARKWLDE